MQNEALLTKEEIAHLRKLSRGEKAHLKKIIDDRVDELATILQKNKLSKDERATYQKLMDTELRKWAILSRGPKNKKKEAKNTAAGNSSNNSCWPSLVKGWVTIISVPMGGGRR